MPGCLPLFCNANLMDGAQSHITLQPPILGALNCVELFCITPSCLPAGAVGQNKYAYMGAAAVAIAYMRVHCNTILHWHYVYIMCKVHVARCTFAVRWKCVKLIESVDISVLIIITIIAINIKLEHTNQHLTNIIEKLRILPFSRSWILIQGLKKLVCI